MEETSIGRARIIDAARKIHWHVVLTHFPISLFMTSAGFMLLHLFTLSECFDLSAFLTLAAGVVMMAPTTLSGWFTWKGSRYRGMRGKIFLYKSRMAYAMLALGISLVTWHILSPYKPHTIWHYAYAASTALLLLGAIAQGYYGGRLTHK